MRLSLSFEHEVIGIMDTGGRKFVTVIAEHPYNEFCTYELSNSRDNSGAPYWVDGGYHSSRRDALKDMSIRANRAAGRVAA